MLLQANIHTNRTQHTSLNARIPLCQSLELWTTFASTLTSWLKSLLVCNLKLSPFAWSWTAWIGLHQVVLRRQRKYRPSTTLSRWEVVFYFDPPVSTHGTSRCSKSMVSRPSVWLPGCQMAHARIESTCMLPLGSARRQANGLRSSEWGLTTSFEEYRSNA